MAGSVMQLIVRATVAVHDMVRRVFDIGMRLLGPVLFCVAMGERRRGSTARELAPRASLSLTRARPRPAR